MEIIGKGHCKWMNTKSIYEGNETYLHQKSYFVGSETGKNKM